MLFMAVGNKPGYKKWISTNLNSWLLIIALISVLYDVEAKFSVSFYLSRVKIIHVPHSLSLFLFLFGLHLFVSFLSNWCFTYNLIMKWTSELCLNMPSVRTFTNAFSLLDFWDHCFLPSCTDLQFYSDQK